MMNYQFIQLCSPYAFKLGDSETASELDTASTSYRPGDIFYLDVDENLCFIDGVDHQIKRSGYRIELQEIESTVLEIGLIKEAVAVSYTSTTQTVIELYLSCSYDMPINILEEQIAEILPHYMIPDRIILTTAFLTKNSNGTIDKKYYSRLSIEGQE